MTVQQVFIISQQALKAVVDQITDDQWELSAEDLAPGKNQTLREAINYHAYDDAWIPDTLAGKTIAEVGDKYAGYLLGANPLAGYGRYNQAAEQAVRNLENNNLENIVHLTYGDFTARDYLKHVTCYRGFRTYTLAKFIGVDATMPSELVDGLWQEVVPEIDGWRAMGVFGPAVDVPDNADKQTELLGLTGILKQ